MIGEGVDTFYVGNQGQFDRTVYGCLKRLRTEYPFIQVWVVLAYLPGKGQDGEDTLYPEGMELGPQKFAIDRRNRWMIRNCQYCLCYIDHTWGGAYKYAMLSAKKGLCLRNLGNAFITI